MAKKHSDIHSNANCGQCNLDFESALEEVNHYSEVEHVIKGFGICATCNKENVPFEQKMKMNGRKITGIHCDDCKKKIAEDYTRGLQK